MATTIRRARRGVREPSYERVGNVFAFIWIFLLLSGTATLGCLEGLERAGRRVDAVWHDVHLVLVQRAALVDELATVIRPSSSHREDAQRLGELRRQTLSAEPSAAWRASRDLEPLVGRMLRSADHLAGPAPTSLRQLRGELEANREQLALAAWRYDEEVRSYNAMLERFPGRLVAGPLGYEPRATLGTSTEAPRNEAYIDVEP